MVMHRMQCVTSLWELSKERCTSDLRMTKDKQIKTIAALTKVKTKKKMNFRQKILSWDYFDEFGILYTYTELPENVKCNFINTSNKFIVQWYGNGMYSLVGKVEKLWVTQINGKQAARFGDMQKLYNTALADYLSNSIEFILYHLYYFLTLYSIHLFLTGNGMTSWVKIQSCNYISRRLRFSHVIEILN